MLNRHQFLKWVQIGAIPLLLLLVGFRQIILVHKAGLSPWHGGGFGMFASVDRDERRVIKVTATNDAGEDVHVDITHPNSIFSDRKLTLIRTIPRRRILQDVGHQVFTAAEQLSETKTATGETVYHLPQNQEDGLSPALPFTLQTVQVQVFRIVHDRQTQEIWYIPVSERVEVNQ